MVSFSLFILSGVGIATLLVAKRLEEKHKRITFILRAISKGEESLHDLHARALHSYSRTKERFYFFATKQLPLKAKIYINKGLAWLKERSEAYVGDIRDSKLLKRSEGISEFFKNIEIEKGSGEIHENFDESSGIIELETEVAQPETMEAPAQEPIKNKRKYTRRKRLQVVSSLEV